MNLDPSDLPRIAGAARLSKPGFDIILAVSSARQAMLPTVRQLRARAQRDRHAAKLNALRYILCGRRGSTEQKAPSVVRSEEHTSELQSLMRISYAVFFLKTQKHTANYI